jgi:WhiB family redox-sensing transcriptional regulator
VTWYERPIDDRPMSAEELLDMALGRPAWMDCGECRTERALTLAWTFGHETATDLFVPPNGAGRRGMAEIVAARQLCEDCAVQAECLAYALDHHPEAGTWGGTSLQQRIAIKKKEGTR